MSLTVPAQHALWMDVTIKAYIIMYYCENYIDKLICCLLSELDNNDDDVMH